MNIAHFAITHLYNIHKNNNKILPFVTKYIDLEGIMLSKKAFLSDQCKEMEKKKKKDRNGMDLTCTEDIKKRWQEYTEELHKKRSSQPR